MFHVIGVIVVVLFVLWLVGRLISPTVVVVVQDPDQRTPGDDFDPRPALEAMAQNFGKELRSMDRRVQHALNQAELVRPPDHRATIDEYRDRIRRGEN